METVAMVRGVSLANAVFDELVCKDNNRYIMIRIDIRCLRKTREREPAKVVPFNTESR